MNKINKEIERVKEEIAEVQNLLSKLATSKKMYELRNEISLHEKKFEILRIRLETLEFAKKVYKEVVKDLKEEFSNKLMVWNCNAIRNGIDKHLGDFK